jgi:hypothetical protein
MLLGGATALALTVALTPGFAQTTQNAPAQQSTPADQTQADPSAAQSGNATGTDASATDQTSTPSVHHHRHHLRTAATESGSERRATNDLNKQQLAQAQAADQQIAQGQSAMATGNSASPADQANGSGPDTGQRSAMNAPSTEGSGSAQAPGETESNTGPMSAPDKTADSASPSSQQNTMTAENTSPGAQNMSAPSAGPQTGPEPVSQVRNAQQTLASAKVQSTGGTKIGTVQAITNDPNGTPTKVQVELDQSLGMGKRSVWINADQLQYEPRDNALTTSLSPDQLSTM